jgi:MFS family permease
MDLSNRRNSVALVLEGTFFFTALAFLDTNVIVPVFLEGLTGGRQLVGVAATLRQIAFLLPTLFMVGVIHRIPDIRSFVLALCWGRLLPLALVASLLLVPQVPAGLLAAVFLGATALFMMADGASQLGWLEVLHGAVSRKQRGKLIGWIQALGGAGAFGAGMLITAMLEQPLLSFRATFALFYGIAALALVFSAAGFSVVRTERLRVKPVEGARFAWWSRIPTILKGDGRYRRALLLQALLASGSLALPFYALYLRDQQAIPPSLIGWLHVAQVLGGIAGGFLLGFVNDRYGPVIALRLSAGVAFSIPGLAILSGFLGAAGMPAAIATFGLIGISMGVWLAQVNYTMTIAADSERPYYFAIGNLLGLSLSLLPTLGGLLTQVIAYPVLFFVVLLLQGGSVWASFRMERAGTPATPAAAG